MKTQRSEVFAVNRQIFSLSNVAKKLIQTFLCLTIPFGYTIANANPTTFKPNTNLISENLSSPALVIDWVNQVGAPNGFTYGKGVSADNSGNVYITGGTSVGISGQTQNGGYDYFITKYGSNYNIIWTKQVGVESGTVFGQGISTDKSGNIYITGWTTEGISGQIQNGLTDYFIAKYDDNGNLIWTKQVGSQYEITYGTGISADNSGNIYVTGWTTGGISGQTQHGYDDYYIAKYDPAGNLLWTRQIGAARGYTKGNGISADSSGNVYITGYTSRAISGHYQTGYDDYFIAKYDSAGNLLWTRQVGAAHGYTYGQGISADNSGNIYVTGYTHGGLSGQKQNGNYDYFVARYDALGNLLVSTQAGGTYGSTIGLGISTDNSGNIYLTGNTNVGLFGLTQNGYDDYFAVKYISIN